MNLVGKNILFFGIGFYDYEEVIKNELTRRGANVSFFNTVYRTVITRMCLRLRLHSLQRYLQDRHVGNYINKINDQFDVIFIIKGEGLTGKTVSLLKNKISGVYSIVYLWDSINRLYNFDLLQANFDRISTFDRKDSVSYNLPFRPLFFREEFAVEKNFQYDISFVGWMHSDRYNILKNLSDRLDEQDLSYRFLLTIGRFTYFWGRYVTKEIRKKDVGFFIFSPILYTDYLKLSYESKAILDISHPLQSGLTIRSIETIGFRRLLMTTNEDIKHYDDIDSSTYVVFSRNDNFFSEKTSIEPLKQMNTKFDRFTIKAFVDDLFVDFDGGADI